MFMMRKFMIVRERISIYINLTTFYHLQVSLEALRHFVGLCYATSLRMRQTVTVTKKNDQNILVKQQPKLSEYTQQPYQLLLSILIGADGA